MSTIPSLSADERKVEDLQVLASILHKVKTVVKSRGQWGRKEDSRERTKKERSKIWDLPLKQGQVLTEDKLLQHTLPF